MFETVQEEMAGEVKRNLRVSLLASLLNNDDIADHDDFAVEHTQSQTLSPSADSPVLPSNQESKTDVLSPVVDSTALRDADDDQGSDFVSSSSDKSDDLQSGSEDSDLLMNIDAEEIEMINDELNTSRE